jgi:hypothetical protein
MLGVQCNFAVLTAEAGSLPPHLAHSLYIQFLHMASGIAVVLDTQAGTSSEPRSEDISVSPSAKIATWRYWFHLFRDRSFASYTKTKTVESAV